MKLPVTGGPLLGFKTNNISGAFLEPFSRAGRCSTEGTRVAESCPAPGCFVPGLRLSRLLFAAAFMVLTAVRAGEPDVEQVAAVRGCSKGQILLTLSKRGRAALLPLIRVFTGGHGGVWVCCWPPGQTQRSREMVTGFFWNAVWDRALCTENLKLFLASALGKDLGAQLSTGRGGELQEGKAKTSVRARGCTLLKTAIFWAESQQDWVFPGPVGTRVAHAWRGSSCEGGGPSCGCWGSQTQRLQHAKSTAFSTALSTALPSDLPRPNLAG